MPDPTHSLILFPFPIPHDVSVRLLPKECSWALVRADFSNYAVFGHNTYTFANVAVPVGMVIRCNLITNEFMILVGDSVSRGAVFLHRIKSGLSPCRNEFVASKHAQTITDMFNVASVLNMGLVVEVVDAKVERFPNPIDGELSFAALVTFKIVEAIPALPALAAEGGDGEDGELDPIVGQCVLLRAENTRLAMQQKHRRPDDVDVGGWCAAVSAVLDHCNRRRLPRSFKVAWRFVTEVRIIETYASDRAHMGEKMAWQQAQAVAAASSAGPVPPEIVEAAVGGYEGSIQRASARTARTSTPPLDPPTS